MTGLTQPELTIICNHLKRVQKRYVTVRSRILIKSNRTQNGLGLSILFPKNQVQVLICPVIINA